ncbi:MAG TPA: regulatory protein RecX [Candidatus Omnitrophica bacterium]|nr:regulatory protein RecX [Candidatus Omnitrophota bacterium]
MSDCAKGIPDMPGLRKAISYVSRLLKVRLRSEEELLIKLKENKFSSLIIDQVIISLKKSGYLDDFNFAARWVSQRIKKPLGFRKLRFELRQKGVDGKIIDSVFSEVSKNY